MIVDSTALPEQAVRDIIASSFQSAGQRCSALRCLYVQADIAPQMQAMIIGAMNELELGDPWQLSTDLGPVITAAAKAEIAEHVERAEREGRLIHRLATPDEGHFVAPALIRIDTIADLDREIFGPVLHLATFQADDLDRVIADINATGYGLTFGLHSRIDERVQKVCDEVRAGNVYANRNQIGAIVGSQPFGGEGLSGTGPKAGGPHYLARFTRTAAPVHARPATNPADPDRLGAALMAVHSGTAVSVVRLPGPTGELNQLSTYARPPVLCLGPSPEAERRQIAAVLALGGRAMAAGGALAPAALVGLPPLGAVIWWGDQTSAREFAQALADRDSPIVPLVTGLPDAAHVLYERHLCVDTTAAGGNASLLAGRGRGLMREEPGSAVR